MSKTIWRLRDDRAELADAAAGGQISGGDDSHVIASAVVRRAERQARRELAALDDRTLGDMGLARSELTSLLEALAETRTAP